ncbi:hypothetical protein ACFY0F_20270 [Streptomyces sp. NPDC001544]|uniref:hypothetical protein n=1 Tax=Streptomyces sp. NPDC001544 TaxID=3364584 RepID=UPI0036A9B249
MTSSRAGGGRERADYAVERARRRYQLAEPQSRLVARERSAAGKPRCAGGNHWATPAAVGNAAVAHPATICHSWLLPVLGGHWMSGVPSAV